MFDWLIRLLGGAPAEQLYRSWAKCERFYFALEEVAALDTPNAAHGVKKAVKIANEALKGEK